MIGSYFVKAIAFSEQNNSTLKSAVVFPVTDRASSKFIVRISAFDWLNDPAKEVKGNIKSVLKSNAKFRGAVFKPSKVPHAEPVPIYVVYAESFVTGSLR